MLPFLLCVLCLCLRPSLLPLVLFTRVAKFGGGGGGPSVSCLCLRPPLLPLVLLVRGAYIGGGLVALLGGKAPAGHHLRKGSPTEQKGPFSVVTGVSLPSVSCFPLAPSPATSLSARIRVIS